METNLRAATRAEKAMVFDMERVRYLVTKLSAVHETQTGAATVVMQDLNAFCEMDTDSEVQAPGLPGFHKDAVMTVASTLVNLLNELGRVGVDARQQLEQIEADVAKAHEHSKKMIEAARCAKVQYETAKATVTQLSPHGRMDKINSLITKMAKKAKKSEKKMKQLRELWAEVVRERGEKEKQREALVMSAADGIGRFEKNILDLRGDADRANADFVGVFDWFVTRYVEIAVLLNKGAHEAANWTDPSPIKKDIVDFAGNRQIVRYDIPCPEFEVCEGDDGDIPVDSTFDYPVGLGQIVEDFVSGGDNELTCVKGKSLLLMELPGPKEDWCCAMNPFTHAFGYVPTYCVQVKGSGLGMCIRDPKPGEYQGVIVKAGDFLAIIENEPKNKMLTIETIHGDVGTVSRAIVYM